MYNYVGADLLSRQGAILSCHVTTFGRSWRLFVVVKLLPLSEMKVRIEKRMSTFWQVSEAALL